MLPRRISPPKSVGINLIRKVNCTLHYNSSIIGAEKRTRSEAREAVH